MPKHPIYYLGQNSTDSTVTFRIGAAVWEYWLDPLARFAVDYMANRVSPGKALAYAKRRATRSERQKALDNTTQNMV